MIPTGVHLFAGSPKIGKSWLALWLCDKVSKGERVWEFDTQKCTVLYIALEDTKSTLHFRIESITDKASKNAYAVTSCNSLSNGLLDEIDNFIISHPDTGLIVIDTLQLVRDSKQSQNYAGDYVELHKFVEYAQEKDIAVILVHHLRKMPDNDIINMVSEMQRTESIDAQIRAINEYTNDNNYILVNKYIDMAKSGKNDDRPQFLQMIQDAKDNLFDIIVVHKLDRFARNRYDSVRYRHELKRNNVKLLSVLENYDSDTPEGVLMESLYEGMNEYYIKNLSREIMKGLKENAYQAKFTGGVPPLGYDIDENLHYVINPAEAEIVRQIFDMSIQNIGYGKIIDELNSKGYKTKTGKYFSKNSLSSLLRNPKYCGIYEFNRAPKRDVDGKRNSHARKSEDEIIRIVNAIPAIISKEDFTIIENKMKLRKQNSGKMRAKEVYLLSGKLVCGKCGMAYVGHRKFNSQKKKYVFYSCNNNQRKKECTAKYIRREYIEGFVLDQISEHVFDESKIPEVCKLYKEYALENNYEAIMQKEYLSKKLKAVDKQIDNIVSIVATTASKSLLNKLEELEQDKITLEFRIENIETECSIQSVTEDELKDLFAIARDLFKKGELSTSKKLIDLFVDRVTVYDEYVELVVKIKPDLSLLCKVKDKSGSFDGDTKSCPLDGARSGNRTHTVLTTRPLNVRVCLFRHSRIYFMNYII